MTGAELFAQSLAAAGIDTVYALPGEETVDLMDALTASSIDVVICRHEQGAAFMASTHGRLTGRPAACLATLGPGATNLVTGVADATLDGVPLIAITGQGARDRIGAGRHSHQILALDRLFDPVTEFSHAIRVADEIPQRVARAVQIAGAELPGAVHLSLPEDVARGPAEGAPFAPLNSAIPHPDPQATRHVAERLAQAQRPVLLAGAGVLRAGAAEALRDFVDTTGVPLASSFMGKGVLPLDHDRYLGTFGLPVEDHVDRAIAVADVLLLVGLDPVEYPFATLNPDAATAAIAAAPLPRDASPSLVAEAVGDPALSLTAIAAELQGQRWRLDPTQQRARAAMLEEGEGIALDAETPTAPALCRAIENAVPEDMLILSGVGTHKLALARNLHPDRPGRMIIPNGLAGMGLALPGAIAAARLDRDRPVLAVCGDGDVMMNLQEMETATRLDVDLTVMVWVDGGYGLIEDKQEKSTGTRPVLSFSDIGWRDLAAAFGWTHVSCATADEVRQALADGFSTRGRRLLTVPVRYSGKLA